MTDISLKEKINNLEAEFARKTYEKHISMLDSLSIDQLIDYYENTLKQAIEFEKTGLNPVLGIFPKIEEISGFQQYIVKDNKSNEQLYGLYDVKEKCNIIPCNYRLSDISFIYRALKEAAKASSIYDEELAELDKTINRLVNVYAFLEGPTSIENFIHKR